MDSTLKKEILLITYFFSAIYKIQAWIKWKNAQPVFDTENQMFFDYDL